jgi:uncharacterized membrane protein YkvI
MGSESSSSFKRLWLPAFAFKAVVIGGGYATGRELAQYFLPSGPWGGLKGMFLATVAWSAICILTFLFAVTTGSHDYRTFFRSLLGLAWPLFDAAYVISTITVLSVFGAAAGAIGHAVFGWPVIAGTIALLAGIVGFSAWGSDSVERLFKYVTILLYSVYAMFLVFGFTEFGGRITHNLSIHEVGGPWAARGLTYAGYNMLGAIAILPVVRHMRSRKDALIAGALCGPLAMLPAVAFFLCMLAYYPTIADQTLPSDYLLAEMHMPAFHFAFQIMILAALLESGTGTVHAVNERVASLCRESGHAFSRGARAVFTCVLLASSVFVAARYGLVDLIAKGYRFLAALLLVVYIIPLLTLGVHRILSRKFVIERSVSHEQSRPPNHY